MIPTPCPGCAKTLQVPEKYAGLKIKCPKCKHPVLVAEPEPELQFDDDLLGPEEDAEEEFPLPPPKRKKPDNPQPKTSSAEGNNESRKFSVPIVCGIAAGCLVVGFFSGRWHLQWVIESRLNNIGDAIASGIQNGIRDAKVGEADSVEPPPKDDPPPRIKLGDTHSVEGLQIKAVGIAVTTPEVESFSGTARLENECLVVTINITNTDDRKILRLQPENIISDGHCWVVDDADNRIRGVRTSRPIIGSLSTSVDVNPGETVSHKFVFKVPPPRTESLTVTVDIDSMFKFGGKLDITADVTEIEGLKG